MNGLWGTGNDSDEDLDSLPDPFDGFGKGFLPQKATRPRRAKATNSDDMHTRHARDASETYGKR
jgi:hypothetical protein